MCGDKGAHMNDLLMTELEEVHDLPALINAGADIFLIALDGYSFTAQRKMKIEQVSFVKDMAQGFGKSVALLVNKLFHEGEVTKLDALFETIRDVQYIIFQDPAVIMKAKQYGYGGKLIYMPDTLVTNRQDAEFYRQQGIMPSVSPVLIKEEVMGIVEDGEAMVTVFGHTILSRSARHLLSAWSAHYEKESLVKKEGLVLVEEKRNGRMPVYEDEEGTCIYSDEVLMACAEMQEIHTEHSLIYFVDGVFLERMAHIDGVHAVKEAMDGKDGTEVENAYREKYPSLQLGKGYSYAKTIL